MDRPVDAIEHHKQRVASSLNDLAAVFVYRWIYQSAAESSEPFERS
jgi:hypothetical protein